ncbi:hypothetical protein KY343_04225 [Candidatus Woesearchaeota archaeon]|nr:hypothetical protein [Candidatus Woesearchaeota archaeon]
MITQPDSIEYIVEGNNCDLQILKRKPIFTGPIDVVVAAGTGSLYNYKGKAKNSQSASYLIANNLNNPKDAQQTVKWMRQYGFGAGPYTVEEVAVADAMIEIIKGLWRNDHALLRANRIYVTDKAFRSETTVSEDENYTYETLEVRAVVTAEVYKRKGKELVLEPQQFVQPQIPKANQTKSK